MYDATVEGIFNGVYITIVTAIAVYWEYYQNGFNYSRMNTD
jgi:hypothetical protein